jgi:hypothetical protein
MEEEIFSFEQFLDKPGKPGKTKPSKVDENTKQEIPNDPILPKEEILEIPEVIENIQEEEIEPILESTDNTQYYNLFVDKSEDFICDIFIEGVNQDDIKPRLIIESPDWSLVFTGEVKNGKCIIPVKKLNLFKESVVGDIRLEVIADNTLFTPWEDKFKTKMSKKVTVKVNESAYKKPEQRGPSVKVNIRK